VDSPYFAARSTNVASRTNPGTSAAITATELATALIKGYGNAAEEAADDAVGSEPAAP